MKTRRGLGGNYLAGGIVLLALVCQAAAQTPSALLAAPVATPSVHAPDVPPKNLDMHQGLIPGTSPHQMGSTSAESRKSVTWSMPQGWSEQPPTSMRLGNFLYTASNGQKVEITVSSFPGAAGGVAANFGMWRSQLGLSALEEAEIMKQSETLRVGTMEMRSIDIVSTADVLDGKFKARIIGVIYPRETSTWFFKMKGEDSAVREAKPSFISFLESLKFLDPSKV